MSGTYLPPLDEHIPGLVHFANEGEHSPQYVMFPNDEGGFGIDDQFYVGSSGLLVKPVTAEGQTATQVYLADVQVNIMSRLCVIHRGY